MIYGYIAKDFNPVDELSAQVKGYAKKHQLQVDEMIVDETTNRVFWKDRALATLLEKQAQRGDHIIVYEASNLARSTSQMLELFDLLVEKGVILHLVKYDEVFESKESVNTRQFLHLMHNIESDFVAKRTTEALARRRAQGLPLGRPKGRKNKSLKLDKYRKEIQKYLNLNISKASIAKLIGCHAQTLYNYIDMRDLKAQSLEIQEKETMS